MATTSRNSPTWKETQAGAAEPLEERQPLGKEPEGPRIEGLGFWKRFVDRAMLSVQGMPRFKGVQLTGGVSATSTGAVRECSIHVARQSTRGGPKQSKMEFWYSPGDPQIQCWYQKERMDSVKLVAHRRGISASIAGKTLSPEQLADHIVGWMIAQVRIGIAD
ncbi:MAG TPA: hypothetical protein VKR52_04860 [Terracidiphilus sp.]|nr:hypothetical protein [Terracidiphilus sp.]